mmetsp:Transcript_69626/g.85391  ORF Transcript_69626/g.85391 Transcript_69626/m.85391 type:complete len:98 (-) Transcript_69626:185-478(-)
MWSWDLSSAKAKALSRDWLCLGEVVKPPPHALGSSAMLLCHIGSLGLVKLPTPPVPPPRRGGESDCLGDKGRPWRLPSGPSRTPPVKVSAELPKPPG